MINSYEFGRWNVGLPGFRYRTLRFGRRILIFTVTSGLIFSTQKGPTKNKSTCPPPGVPKS